MTNQIGRKKNDLSKFGRQAVVDVFFFACEPETFRYPFAFVCIFLSRLSRRNDSQDLAFGRSVNGRSLLFKVIISDVIDFEIFLHLN